MKPDWCGCSLNNRITDSNQGNNYLSGLDDKIMNGVYPLCLITNWPSKFKPRLHVFYGNA